MHRPRPKTLGASVVGAKPIIGGAPTASVVPPNLRVGAPEAKRKVDALSMRSSAAKNSMR